jgi:magnesium-transporting ATPase (P-type)
VDAEMTKNILLFAGIISIGCLGFFLLHYKTDINVARTGTFLLLILLEFVVIQVIRSSYGIKFWSNLRLFIAIGGSILLTLILVYVPTLASIFKLTPLSL